MSPIASQSGEPQRGPSERPQGRRPSTADPLGKGDETAGAPRSAPRTARPFPFSPRPELRKSREPAAPARTTPPPNHRDPRPRLHASIANAVPALRREMSSEAAPLDASSKHGSARRFARVAICLESAARGLASAEREFVLWGASGRGGPAGRGPTERNHPSRLAGAMWPPSLVPRLRLFDSGAPVAFRPILESARRVARRRCLPPCL